MSEKTLLKDKIFNEISVTRLADLFYAQDSSFPRKKFIKNILQKFPDLELKQRISCITDELKKILPADFKKAQKKIVAMLPPVLDETQSDNDFGEFILSPLAEYIEHHGCSSEHIELSLQTLGELTMCFSVEFSIRKFLNEFPVETFLFLQDCAQSTHYHKRRLASEGLRLNLPWAQKITTDYRKSKRVLDVLFYDKTRYVTRSVANHLNDVSKIDPEFVLNTIQEWKLSGHQNEKEMSYITGHALRTLVKQGNKKALQMLGYKKPAQVDVSIKKISKNVSVGEFVDFTFEIISHRKQKLLISYYLYFLNKKNELNPKIFQIKKITMCDSELQVFSKKHPLKTMTTKKLYPGKHAIQIIVNGLAVTDKVYFTLTK